MGRSGGIRSDTLARDTPHDGRGEAQVITSLISQGPKRPSQPEDTSLPLGDDGTREADQKLEPDRTVALL